MEAVTDDDMVQGKPEPLGNWIGRASIIIICYIIFIFVFSFFLTITMILLSIIVLRVQSKRAPKVVTSVRQVERRGRVNSVTRKLPAVLTGGEARDCPICLLEFKETDQVVQLKCNEYHVFHYRCMNDYLSYKGPAESDPIIKKCPLCRSKIDF